MQENEARQDKDNGQYALIDALVKKAKAGDSGAQTQLLIAYTPLIKSMIKRYVYDTYSYEDALQEGCLIILAALRRYDPEKGVYFSAYIKRQLFYHFVQKPKETEKQAEKNALRLDEETGEEALLFSELLAAPKSGVEEVIEKREADAHQAHQTASLAALMERLAPRQRQAICAHYFGGCRVRDMAVEWNLSENAGSQLIHRGLRRLAALIKEI